MQTAIEDHLKLYVSELEDREVAQRVPTTFRQLARLLERAFGPVYYVYDACPGRSAKKPCHLLYRCEYKDLDSCPKCGTPRRKPNGQAALLMPYHALHSYVQFLYKDPDLAR